jgi:hypothetical protein
MSLHICLSPYATKMLKNRDLSGYTNRRKISIKNLTIENLIYKGSRNPLLRAK